MSKEQKQKQKKNKPQVTHYYRADWETGRVYREPDGEEPKYSEAQMQEIRLAVARYMYSEGCSCCQSDNHYEHKEALGRLLNFPAWEDEPDKQTDFYTLLREAGEIE